MTQLKDLKNYQVTPPGHAVTKGTGGEWTGSPTFEANGAGAADDRTKFTDSGADFQAYMVGWLLQPDVELPSYLEIVEVDESSGNWVRVKGDADTLATSGSTYRLHAPPGVDRATGALITGLEQAGSRWLWAGYEYVPPMVGFADPQGQDPGTYGAQPGGNKLGSYHCWNRVYQPATGRWTTPDPAKTPWSNLIQYTAHTPLTASDQTGLATYNGQECEGHEVKIATSPKDSAKDDGVDKAAAGFVGEGNVSRSDKDFFEILKKTTPTEDCKCDCISRIDIYGHAGQGLGGGGWGTDVDPDTGKTYGELISEWLCDDAVIVNHQCFGGVYDFDRKDSVYRMIMLLARGGGSYIGWTGEVIWHPYAGKWTGPWWHGGDKKTVKVEKGDTAVDLRKRYPKTAARGGKKK